MSSKEIIALDYLFYRKPANYMLALGPLIISTIVAALSLEATKIENNIWNEIHDNQIETIQEFLVVFKMSFVILASFFICYRSG